MKVSEMRVMETPELRQELEAAYREQFNLRLRWATRQLSNYYEIKKARKNIARLKTLLRERELVGRA